jgi:hypothetical protein
MKPTFAVFLVFFAGSFVVACQDQISPASEPMETIVSAQTEIYLPEGDPASGRQGFLDFNCHTCHSIPSEGIERRVQGELGPELGSALAAQPREDIATSIIAPSHAFGGNAEDWKSGDLSRMGDFSEHLTVRQWMDLVAYLKSLQ